MAGDEEKVSGDVVAAIAGRLMKAENHPLDDDSIVDQMVLDVKKALEGNDYVEARRAIRRPLEVFQREVISLASSVVSQADGPENASDCGA
jgi:hypothetical protein